MSVVEEFDQIVKYEREHDLISFLSSLSKENKVSIVNSKKDFQHYWEYSWKESTHAGHVIRSSDEPKGTDKQKEILALAMFVCDNLKGFTNEWSNSRFISKSNLDKILPWYIPSWFDKFINEITRDGWTVYQLDYFDLVYLESKGYCKLSTEIIVNKIPQAIYLLDERKRYYKPERLLDLPITLENHIWLLFENESGIHWSDTYVSYENHSEGYTWQKAFQFCLDKGRIDRKMLLKSALLATNRNFNKNSSGWFAGLFIFLNPSKEELFELNPELLSVLNSPHSKVVNMALKFVKLIVASPNYDHLEFVENASFLLTSQTKSVAASVMMIFDKIATKREDLRTRVCLASCQVFIQQDPDLQLRAAKLIDKHASECFQNIQEELDIYGNELMFDAKKILERFVRVADPELDSSEVIDTNASGQPINSLISIPHIDSFEDLVYLASQAFDNNEPFHFDMLPMALLKFREESFIHSELLEPAFQRAFKTLTNDWNSRIGFLDHLLAVFFINFGQIVLKDTKGNNGSLAQMYLSYIKKDKQLARDSEWYSPRIINIGDWNASDNSPAYFLFKKKLQYVLNKLEVNDSTPLLSTPTHLPCWVDPMVLIDRIKYYQERSIKVDENDLQMALARCLLSVENVQDYALKQLSGEMLSLVCYLFGDGLGNTSNLNYPRAWQVAALTRKGDVSIENLAFFRTDLKYYVESYEWQVRVTSQKGQQWDSSISKMMPYTYDQKNLRLNRFYYEGRKTWKSILLNATKLKSSTFDGYPYYTCFELKPTWMSSEANDVFRLFSAIPNNPEHFLISLMSRLYRWPTMSGEGDKRVAIRTLEFALNTMEYYPKAFYDFLGMSFLASDKTVRSIAGEIWIVAVNRGQIDNVWIGKAIAKMMHLDFTPMKRFLDEAQTLYIVSSSHKNKMNELLVSCVKELPDDPIRNLKALLMLLIETVEPNSSFCKDVQMINKLEAWKKVKSLSPTINKILML
ncbi:DUF6493 family protein [Roseivirga sp.]|uniref:DUF6493 family protein n=1 Tax=Roseivirga sp. TaxID=1964215 RepID=UPI002B26CCF1|nr:DUF6493 family protein [Roseivirga sp.]